MSTLRNGQFGSARGGRPGMSESPRATKACKCGEPLPPPNRRPGGGGRPRSVCEDCQAKNKRERDRDLWRRTKSPAHKKPHVGRINLDKRKGLARGGSVHTSADIALLRSRLAGGAKQLTVPGWLVESLLNSLDGGGGVSEGAK